MKTEQSTELTALVPKRSAKCSPYEIYSILPPGFWVMFSWMLTNVIAIIPQIIATSITRELRVKEFLSLMAEYQCELINEMSIHRNDSIATLINRNSTMADFNVSCNFGGTNYTFFCPSNDTQYCNRALDKVDSDYPYDDNLFLKISWGLFMGITILHICLCVSAAYYHPKKPSTLESLEELKISVPDIEEVESQTLNL